MKRFLKHRIKQFLPDAVRRALKRRFEAQFHGPIEHEFLLKQSDGVLRCTIDERFSFRAPLSCEEQLIRFTTGDGRAEFDAIACAALQGGVLFEIGAHSGVISALFCAARPQNRAIAFEPSPILARGLREIRDLNQSGDRMRIEELAIGDRGGTLEMLIDPVGGFVQARRFEQTMWGQPQCIEVPLERIADAAARLDVVPNFIKLDVEGFEYEAIKGSLEFLARHKPLIFLELHLNYLEERKLSARAVVEMLQSCRYGFHAYSGARLRGPQVYDSPLAAIHFVAR